MSNEPQSISDAESYMGYEIAYRIIGPIATNPNNPEDTSTHFKASVSLFHEGKQVDGTLEHLQEKYEDAEAAKESAIAQGRILVGQRR